MNRPLTEQEKDKLRAELWKIAAAAPPYDPSPQEALDELVMATSCHCSPAYSERGMHGNDCWSAYRIEVVTLGRAAGLRVPA